MSCNIRFVDGGHYVEEEEEEEEEREVGGSERHYGWGEQNI
jgi:hypothetical protein